MVVGGRGGVKSYQLGKHNVTQNGSNETDYWNGTAPNVGGLYLCTNVSRGPPSVPV